MDRRNLLKTMGLMMAMPVIARAAGDKNKAADIIKPAAIKEGDTVAIIAPGTAVSDPDDLLRAEEILKFLKLNFIYGKNTIKGSGYKSRSIKERVDDLHHAFADDSVKAVFCIRGGYGSGQLLDSIDYGLIRSNPKVFTGYSDITALHIAIGKYSGLITFHGPVLLSSFVPFTLNYYKKAVFSREPIGKIHNPNHNGSIRDPYPTRTINGGKAKGRLTGGNLTLVCSLMGTPYEIETEGKILCIEDVGEEPYRIDRMLTQLRLAGKLEKAAGIAFGRCVECGPKQFEPSTTWDYSLGEVLDNILGGLGIPVFYGLTFGHSANQATLPMGIEAEINADEGYLDVTEPAVI